MMRLLGWNKGKGKSTLGGVRPGRFMLRLTSVLRDWPLTTKPPKTFKPDTKNKNRSCRRNDRWSKKLIAWQSSRPYTEAPGVSGFPRIGGLEDRPMTEPAGDTAQRLAAARAGSREALGQALET